MADPPLIAAAHVVGEWDPLAEVFFARDWTPGPAGTAPVPLQPGIELDVDIASPTTFVGLRIDMYMDERLGRPQMGALTQLLGRARRNDLLHLQHGAGQPKVLRPLTGPSRPDPYGGPQRPGPRRGTDRPGGVAQPLAVLGLVAAAQVEPVTSPLVRALLHLDRATSGYQLSTWLGLSRQVRADALAGAELILDLARRGELDHSGLDDSALASTLVAAARLLPDAIAGEVSSLSRRRRRAAREETPPGEMAFLEAPAMAAAATPSAAAALVPALDRRTLPQFLATTAIAVRRTTPSELEVRVEGAGDEVTGWWARAFAPDGTLLAAAPLAERAGDAIGRVLVAPQHVANVELDLVPHPAEPRPSRRLRTIADALALGRAAARADRLRRRVAAAQRWHEASRAWAEAGDPTHAGLAAELASASSHGRHVGNVQPLLADAVIEADTT